MSRCQVLAGRVHYAPRAAIIHDLRQLIAELPDSLTGSEQLLIRSVLPQTFSRIAQHLHVDDHPTVAREFLTLGTLCWGTAWRCQWRRLVDSCALAVCHLPESDDISAADALVRRILRVVAERHHERGVALKDVARDVNLSPCYVVRLLRQVTGVGFVTHLHLRRVASAERLLKESSLTIKEIACTIGYAHPSQFSRHFRRVHGITPLSFRAHQRERNDPPE